jgi:hypothetical protein
MRISIIKLVKAHVWYDHYRKGRTIRKVMGEGGRAKAKIKIEQGKQKKKFVHQKCLKKKICAETFQ